MMGVSKRAAADDEAVRRVGLAPPLTSPGWCAEAHPMADSTCRAWRRSRHARGGKRETRACLRPPLQPLCCMPGCLANPAFWDDWYQNGRRRMMKPFVGWGLPHRRHHPDGAPRRTLWRALRVGYGGAADTHAGKNGKRVRACGTPTAAVLLAGLSRLSCVLG